MIRVWLLRFVSVAHGEFGEGWFVRAVELPFAPYPHLGLVIHSNADPVEVDAVWINKFGAVIVELPNIEYDDWHDDYPENRSEECAVEGLSQFAWETRMWIRCETSLSHYKLKPPTDGELTPLAPTPPPPSPRPKSDD